jgi:hypothetical protein
MKKLALLILLIINLNLFSQETIDLFVWAGQSNALGRQGDAAQYPTDTNNLDNQIRFNWIVPNGGNSGGWTSMEPQDLGHYFPDGHFGPEVTFSRKLVQAGYNPAIFKFTQGATSIFQHWLNPGDAGLYDSMVASLNTAITELENQGHTVNVRGLVWIQGESDSNTDASANAYFNNLTTLLNDLRTNVINNPELPIILGVDEQFFNLTDHERHQILNTHQDIALNDENIKFTSMYGYPKADVTHLTPEGLISHGEDLFDSFQLLISGAYPSENCLLTSVGNHSSFDRTAWGQSFTTDCSGTLSTLTFESITLHDDTATFTIYNSADCSGNVLLTKTLNLIDVGDNSIDLLSDNLYLEKEHTYYFDIVSDTETGWGINFSDTTDTNDVFGVLRCTSDDGTANCGRTFLDFDMDFSVELMQESICSVLSSGSEVSFERNSWGQSFIPSCTGNLNSITFSSESALNENAVFYLYAGTDCNATEIFTQSLNEIILGNNTINIDGVTLNENNTYFFQIVVDNDVLWRISYSNTNIVEGMLACTSNDGTETCGRTFPSFDMNFSAVIGDSNDNCANSANIYSFVYDGKTYEVVKEAKSWVNAAACAVERGGFLTEINNQAEQDAVFAELQNANITLANTVASNGGGASYVWIGGNDLDVDGVTHEGIWIWDGNNDGVGSQFWQGDTNGNPVDGLYSNWGNEPDNAGGQDGLSIALTQWPIGSGSLGSAGQWNDLIVTDPLYYVIEYADTSSIDDVNVNTVKIYPNPVKGILFIKNNSHSIASVKIINVLGQEIKNTKFINTSNSVEVDFSSIDKGTYFVRINFTNGKSVVKKVIK